MLEQRIEKLENEIGSLSKGIATLTASVDRLIEIMSAGATPPPVIPAALASNEPVETKSVSAKAKDVETKETAPAKTARDFEVTDVQKALADLAKEYGREGALSILDQYNAKKVGDLKASDYAGVIHGCANYNPLEQAA